MFKHLCFAIGQRAVYRGKTTRFLGLLLTFFSFTPISRGAGIIPLSQDFFPIGVWSQPSYSFDKWKSRGINTLMRYEGLSNTVSNSSWSADARARGLYYIRQPGTNLVTDRNDPNLLAWMHEDEPDYRNRDPLLLATDYAAWKAVDPQKPVLVNFSGGNVISGATPQSKYLQYLPSADWISNDFYPVSGWGRPDWIDYGQNVPNRRTPAMALNKLRQWSGGKPQFAVIETSNYKLPHIPNSRGVTADEFRGELWHTIIHGAKGVIYFPQQIGGGFKFDAIPTVVVDEMIEQHARIRSVAAVINSSPEMQDDLISFTNPVLEGTTRLHNGDEYFFVLNMSNLTLDDQPLFLDAGRNLKRLGVMGENRSILYDYGHATDDFAPFEVHIYKADLKGQSIQPTEIPAPEPGIMLSASGLVILLSRRRKD